MDDLLLGMALAVLVGTLLLIGVVTGVFIREHYWEGVGFMALLWLYMAVMIWRFSK